MNKIIFLDIDGPVIDLLTYKTNVPASIFRTGFNLESIRLLDQLCNVTGAKIVTNSMHNYYEVDNCSLKYDLISNGIDSEHFHKEWRTIYPKIDYKARPSSVRGIGRLYAIEDWIEKNGPCEWICFDDRKFTDDPRLIHITRWHGIDQKYYNEALEKLNGNNS